MYDNTFDDGWEAKRQQTSVNEGLFAFSTGDVDD
jgi:hypothetical protein